MRGEDPECERRRPPKAIKEVAEEIRAIAEANGLTVTMAQALALARDCLAQGDVRQQLNVWYDRRPGYLQSHEDFICAFWDTAERLYPPGSGAYQPRMPPMAEAFISHLLNDKGGHQGWISNPHFLRVFLTTCAPNAPHEVAAAIRSWLGVSFEGNDVAEAAERDRTTAIFQMGGELRDALVAFQEVLLLAPSLLKNYDRIKEMAANLIRLSPDVETRVGKLDHDREITTEQKCVVLLTYLRDVLVVFLTDQ